MTQVTREYSPAKGATFGKEKAQIYGEFLDGLCGDLGEMTPQEVVDAARPEDSPIHEYFEWDDRKAADGFRLVQARSLVNHIKVKIITESSDEEEIDMFVSVRTEGGAAPRTYAHMRRVLSVDDYREQAVSKALRELRYWRAKYQQFSTLTPLMEAIDEALVFMEA